MDSRIQERFGKNYNVEGDIVELDGRRFHVP